MAQHLLDGAVAQDLAPSSGPPRQLSDEGQWWPPTRSCVDILSLELIFCDDSDLRKMT